MANEQLLPWINSGDQDGNRNSMASFPGDGTTTEFSFNFAGGYISQTDVKAYTYDSTSGLTTPVALTPDMFISADTIRLAAPLATGIYLVIYRDTQKTVPLVDYSTNAVFSESNLDTSNKQAVFAAAEMADRFDAVNSSSADAIARSFSALTTAQQAEQEAASAVTTANGTIATASAAQTAANAAVNTANDAKTTADGIDAKAQSALDNSTSAVSTANAASTTANGIDAKATTALTNSQTAVTTANTASGTANDAKTTADGIASTANTALSNSQNAVTTANAAQALAAAALPVHATPPTSDVGPVNVPGIGVMEWAANLGRYIPGGFLGAWDLTQPLPADLGVVLDTHRTYELVVEGAYATNLTYTTLRGILAVSVDGTTWVNFAGWYTQVVDDAGSSITRVAADPLNFIPLNAPGSATARSAGARSRFTFSYLPDSGTGGTFGHYWQGEYRVSGFQYPAGNGHWFTGQGLGRSNTSGVAGSPPTKLRLLLARTDTGAAVLAQGGTVVLRCVA